MWKKLKPSLFGNIFISMNICAPPPSTQWSRYYCEIALIWAVRITSTLFQLEMLNLGLTLISLVLALCWNNEAITGPGSGGIDYSPLILFLVFKNPSAEQLNEGLSWLFAPVKSVILTRWGILRCNPKGLEHYKHFYRWQVFNRMVNARLVFTISSHQNLKPFWVVVTWSTRW